MTTDDAAKNSHLSSLIQSHRQRYIEMLRALLVKSAEGEEALQRDIAARFASLGCQVESIASAPNRFALEADFAPPAATREAERTSVAAVRPGTGGGRDLLVFAHPDGEPVAGADQWRHHPFAGSVDQGRMYGWAIADDLSGVVAMLCAQDALETAGMALSGQVVYASAVSKRRAQGIYAVLEKGYRADAGVYLHPAESGAGLADIKSRAAGLLRFRITVPGKLPDTSEPTHTPFAHLAVSAIDKAWLVCRALADLDERRAQRVCHPAYDEIGRSTNLHITHIAAGDESRPGRMPESAVMHGALTFPPGESLADIQREVEGALLQASEADPWLSDQPAQLEWLQGIGAVEIPEASAIYQTVAGAIRAVKANDPQTQSLHAASEIRTPFFYSDIPTIGFGPLSGGNTQSGGTDEWVSVDDFINMVEVVARTIVDWCQ